MDVASPGGVGMVNNTSASVHFRGSSWRRMPASGFRGDTHVATAEGDAFAFTFEGTDIEWIGSRGKDQGKVELTLDGEPQGVIDLSQGEGRFVSVVTKRDLPRGKHTLIGTKRGVGSVSVDAFRVSDLMNDAGSDVVFSTTTRHGATAAGLEGPWEPRGNTWINGRKFTFTFTGIDIDIEVAGGAAHGSGDLELNLDGKPHSTVHCNVSEPSRTLASITGLPNQPHVIIGVYTNPHPAGFISALDGFTVTRPDYWSYQNSRGLGENFSSVRLAIDAIRVHKGEASSGSPLFWGADGRSGSGVWHNGVSANWNDGVSAASWLDFGAEDHLAVFAGKGGAIELAAPVRANRLCSARMVTRSADSRSIHWPQSDHPRR